MADGICKRCDADEFTHRFLATETCENDFFAHPVDADAEDATFWSEYPISFGGPVTTQWYAPCAQSNQHCEEWKKKNEPDGSPQ